MPGSFLFRPSKLSDSGNAFKRNLWAVFTILLLLGIGILCLLAWFTWDRVYSEVVSRQRNAVNIVASSTLSNLNAQENFLDLVGTQLLDNDHYLDTEWSRQFLNRLMKNNRSIAGLGLSKVDGEVILTSESAQQNKPQNLKTNPHTADSFDETLNSQHIVVGRTYYVDALERWIIPIRKAIRNESGEPIAVISAALEITGENSFLEGQGVETSEGDFLHLVRETDLYFQYVSPSFLKLRKDAYDIPVPKEVYISGVKKLAKLGISRETILTGEHAYSVELVDRMGIEALHSIRYLPEQQLWVIARTDKHKIVKQFLSTFIWFFISFLMTTLTVFGLFRKLISTEQKRLSELDYKSHHDNLTKLPNLSKLELLVKAEELDLSEHFSVFFIDIDNFKFVNETYGRHFGDLVLVDFAERLKKSCPEPNCVVHVSSDKFVVIKATPKDSVKQAIDTLRKTLTEPYTKNDANIILTASIGIAHFPEHGGGVFDLIRLAETIMFEAKKHKNQYLVFDTSIYQNYQQRLRIEQQLKTATGTDQFYMLYQPQVDRDGHILGVEALARWNNPTLGYVPPDQFISIAETSGLMASVGQHLFKMIEQDIRDLDSHLTTNIDVAINISATQFLQDDFVEFICRRFNTSHFKHVNFVLELTENIFIEDLDYLHEKIDELHECGFGISLDDFGTGFSSLSLLRDVPFDELKIDKSFVDTIVEDKTSSNMIRNIISIGNILGLSTIAEGVESKEQLNVLEMLNCHRFQGYYFSKPISIQELLELIKEGHEK